jgi:hypothetical protein
MKKIIFNDKKLAADILAKRERENLSFRVIEAASGIPSQMLFRMEARACMPSCENFALVLSWLGKKSTDYFTTKK